MVDIIQFSEIKPKLLSYWIKQGYVFIYPTDTIYGLGCDATNDVAVERIREIKKRFDKPFSVIAPSKSWISRNFYIKSAYLDKLPGPFTYVLKAKSNKLVSSSVVKGDKIGIRVPDHPITPMIQKSKVPFVTTSVNVTGKKPYHAIRKIPKKILNMVDIVIDEGYLTNSPSTVIDLTGELPKIIR
ncbi:threonylcarbamoyl-AMP synthase [Candidatus Woesearchaeota archaeon]|nr:MAG: threonylcarbamoyl-AMP synthase [Candidatus Woesearchaeota archaeon]